MSPVRYVGTPGFVVATDGKRGSLIPLDVAERALAVFRLTPGAAFRRWSEQLAQALSEARRP